MADAASKWDDLRVRVISGLVMVAVGTVEIIAGGIWFQMLVVFATAVMVWELWMMIEPDRPTSGMILAALLASVMSGQFQMASTVGLLLFLVVPVAGSLMIKREKALFFVMALAIQLAGWGLVKFRIDFGLVWLIWLILIIIASDTFGYLAGRTLGGPKFWPKISPKKTWSGTIAGWVAAGVIGIIFAALTEATWVIVPISMILAFSGQMGDIAESAVKRRMNIKDSSTLIPGHGGFLDRFDALLGASLFMLCVVYLLRIPGVAF